MQFESLGLSAPILRAVRAAGYAVTTPIQEKAIPPALEGYDVLGCAQTGTGKTAAFALPILEILAEERPPARPIRSLIVTPTRELAAQIGDSLTTYGRYLPLRSTVIFGGVTQMRQVEALKRGVDILVATPGRLLDLMDQGYIKLDHVEILVLDEADRMLDMGFIHDVKKIVARVPSDRQTLFFSATMPAEIQTLASSMLVDPVHVAITPQATAAETVVQKVYLVERADKQQLLAYLLRDPAISKALVFTRTKHGADRVAKHLGRAHIDALAIHGNKSQNARTRALDSFRGGNVRVLVASDIASRGLDIDEVSHVINFDLPNEPEIYVHRIGRTGRAGAAGIALSFCASEERGFLRSIERVIRDTVPVDDDQPFHASFTKMPVEDRQARPARPTRPAERRDDERQRDGARGRKPSERRDGAERRNRVDQSRRGDHRPQAASPGREGQGRSRRSRRSRRPQAS